MWEWLTSIKPNSAIIVPTENFYLFQLAEERSCNVGTLLNGFVTPLTSMEFEIYNQYNLVKARLEQQARK